MKPNAFSVFLMGIITLIVVLSACATHESDYEPGIPLAITATITNEVVTTLSGVQVVTRVITIADVPDTSGPTATPPFPLMPHSTLLPRPDFIKAVSPSENRVIPIDIYSYLPDGVVFFGLRSHDKGMIAHELFYASSICVEPVATLLVQEGDSFVDYVDYIAGVVRDGLIEQRMELLVDGKGMDYLWSDRGFPIDLPTREPEGPRTSFIEWASYCWHAPLGVGVHEVTFRFHQTSGDVKEYTWYFELSE